MFDALDRSLAARLVGGAHTMDDRSVDAGVLNARIADHGIGPLLHALPGRLEGLPPPVADRVRQEARARAMWDLRHRQILRDLLADLAEREVECLVLKGSALAYTLYDPPSARPRGDTDLLIRRDRREQARAALDRAGFACGTSEAGTLLQENWWVRLDDSSEHVIDLHWATLNSPFLADVLPFDRLAGDAVAVPDLGDHARQPSPSDTLLLLACHWALNRSGTYHVEDRVLLGRTRLIGLYDVHLLTRAMTGQDWSMAVARAGGEGLSQVCRGLLAECRDLFGTPLPDAVMAQLAQAPRSTVERYLLDRSRWRRALADIAAIAPLRRRLSYAAGRARSYLRTRLAP